MTITVINTPIEVSFATPSEIVTFLKKNINHDNNDDREEGSRRKREKRLGKQQVIPLSTLEIKKDEILLEIQLAATIWLPNTFYFSPYFFFNPLHPNISMHILHIVP